MREDRQRVARPSPHRDPHGGRRGRAGGARRGRPRARRGARHPDAPSAWSGLPLVLGVGAPACVGLVLVLRRPDTRVAWILLDRRAVGRGRDGRLRGREPRARREPAVRGRCVGARAPRPSGSCCSCWPFALAFLFPDGRLPSPRWRVPATVALASAAGTLLLLPLQPELDGPHGEVPNPLVGGVDFEFLAPVFWACWFGLLFSLFAGALALRARYRAGGRERRRQVLWLAYGAVLPPLWLGGMSLRGPDLRRVLRPRTCSC